MMYGYWTRVFKSGGYNLRNSVDLATFPDASPKADDETVETLEFGMKTDFEKGRLNWAFFNTVVDDSQRMTNIQDPVSGVAHVVKNAGDNEYIGFEIDVVYTKAFLLYKLSLITSFKKLFKS